MTGVQGTSWGEVWSSVGGERGGDKKERGLLEWECGLCGVGSMGVA